ncbi:thiol:disulfide interchange protein DsbA/DsbL [Paraglaciecola aestuariivivens]
MKKILTIALLSFLLPLQACAQEKWREGTHYRVIADQATEKKQVLEFFSFWCPHCYQFEPLVKEIKSKLAEDVEFKKVHVNFMGFTSPAIQDEATKAMMIGRTLNQSEELNQAIFKYLHVSNSAITSLKDLRNIFVINGVSPEDFDKTAKSFAVNSQVKLNNKTISDYRKHISGVPNFIVNGKYQATFTRDMTTQDMIDLVVFLTNKK